MIIYLTPSYQGTWSPACTPGLWTRRSTQAYVRSASPVCGMWVAYLGVGESIEGVYPGTLVETDPDDNA